MKRLVFVDLVPAYALIAIGALVELLDHAGTGLAYVAVVALYVIGIAIIFDPMRIRNWRSGRPTGLPGAGRSTGSR